MTTTRSVRTQIPFLETMEKYHGEIDRILYAAEIHCTHRIGERCGLKRPHRDGEICPFKKDFGCSLAILRMMIGDHFKQEDIDEIFVPPGRTRKVEDPDKYRRSGSLDHTKIR